MWRKQEEEEEEERERDDFDEYFEGSKSKTCFQYEESLSWEEQAFAEDAGRLGACVWPPTSYSCSFCRREFRSAQALGGHMNVHRRDRARLNQSPNNNNNPNFTTTLSSSSSPSHHHLSTSPNYHLPNPNPSPPNDGRSDPKAEKDEELRNSCSRVRDKQHVENGVLDEGLNLGFGRSRPTTGLFCEDDEDAGAVTGCKRRKTESSIQFYVKSSSLVENQHHHHIQSEKKMKISNEKSAKYGKFLKISLVFWCIAFLFLLLSFTQKPINCPISHRRKTTAVESSQSQPPTNISHLLFGIAGSTKTWKKRQSYCELWWKPNITRGFVWVDEKPNATWPATSPPYIVSADTSAFSYTCWYGSRSAIRLARIVKESFELGLENVRWFVMGDDDTVFFVENLVNVLGKYDHNQMYYIGSNSESVEQNLIHLYGTAYGGGGYAISYPLAVELVRILDGCLDRYASLYGGDQKVHACVTEIGVPLTKETGFHQVDIRGSQYGLLAAHPMAPLVSLHHVDYLPPIFPTMTQIESLRTLKTAYDLDPGRTLQQSFCYDLARNWSISVSWGYTVQLYPWLATPQDMAKSFQTFQTWKSWSDGPFTFNTRPVQSDPCQMPILFFLDPVEGLNRTASSYQRQLEVWEKDCGRDEFQLAEKVERFRVVTFGQLFTAAHWLKAPRRECCQVVNGTTSSGGGVDSVVNVHIRPCNPFETMTP